MPLFPLWLTAKGLDAQQIGIVLALPMVVRIAAVPLATRAADRRDALRGLLVLLSVAAAAIYAVIGLADGALAISVVLIFGSFAWTPVVSLTDAYALKGLRARGRAYGPVRLWGSAAYIAASLFAGLLIDVVSGRQLVWFLCGVMVLVAAVSFALAPLDRRRQPSIPIRQSSCCAFPGCSPWWRRRA